MVSTTFEFRRYMHELPYELPWVMFDGLEVSGLLPVCDCRLAFQDT